MERQRSWSVRGGLKIRRWWFDSTPLHVKGCRVDLTVVLLIQQPCQYCSIKKTLIRTKGNWLWRSGENKKRLNRHFCKPLASVRLGIHRYTHIFWENEITSSTLVCATFFAEIVQRLVQASHTRRMAVRFCPSVQIMQVCIIQINY